MGRPKGLTAEAALIEAGKQNFSRFGCVGCDGLQVQGGLPNPNSQGGEVPSLLHVADDYTKPEVAAIIRNGKMPPLADAKGPAPPLYMPGLETDAHRRRGQPHCRVPLVAAAKEGHSLVGSVLAGQLICSGCRDCQGNMEGGLCRRKPGTPA